MNDKQAWKVYKILASIINNQWNQSWLWDAINETRGYNKTFRVCLTIGYPKFLCCGLIMVQWYVTHQRTIWYSLMRTAATSVPCPSTRSLNHVGNLWTCGGPWKLSICSGIFDFSRGRKVIDAQVKNVYSASAKVNKAVFLPQIMLRKLGGLVSTPTEHTATAGWRCQWRRLHLKAPARGKNAAGFKAAEAA